MRFSGYFSSFPAVLVVFWPFWWSPLCFVGFMAVLVAFWLFGWFAGCHSGFPAVSVVSRLFRWFPVVSVLFRRFQWFPGCFGDFLPLWGTCLAISVIAWLRQSIQKDFHFYWVWCRLLLVACCCFNLEANPESHHYT